MIQCLKRSTMLLETGSIIKLDIRKTKMDIINSFYRLIWITINAGLEELPVSVL